MIKKMFLGLMAVISVINMNAQDLKLPAPQQNEKAMPVTEALATRQSVREFSQQELTQQQISNLCWAACGVSRDVDHRTAPTARNFKEVDLYVFSKDAVYMYCPVENMLVLKAKGDYRRLVAGGSAFSQDFVLDAPLSLVMVADLDKMGDAGEHTKMMACVDVGNVSENINLYCQAVGLATVPRATMDVSAIKTLLGLSENQLPIMNNPVGYAK